MSLFKRAIRGVKGAAWAVGKEASRGVAQFDPTARSSVVGGGLRAAGKPLGKAYSAAQRTKVGRLASLAVAPFTAGALIPAAVVTGRKEIVRDQVKLAAESAAIGAAAGSAVLSGNTGKLQQIAQDVMHRSRSDGWNGTDFSGPKHKDESGKSRTSSPFARLLAFAFPAVKR
jgi:hypothetical protein